MKKKATHVIAINFETRQVGCALLQAAMGCDTAAFRRYFADLTEHWQLAPSDDLRIYKSTDDQLQRFRDMLLAKDDQ